MLDSPDIGCEVTITFSLTDAYYNVGGSDKVSAQLVFCSYVYIDCKAWKLSTSRDGPIKGTETRKGWKHNKTILLQKSRGKERLEDYSTSVEKLLGNIIPSLFMYFL